MSLSLSKTLISGMTPIVARLSDLGSTATAVVMRNWPLAFVLLWAGFIFGTSCAVVSTDQLFSLVSFVCGPEAVRQFEMFWGIAWFTVVKGWHAAEFAILTAALIASLNAWRPLQRPRNILLAGILCVLFAASDEFHQTYVPTRGGSVWDVLIDSLGVGLVVLFCLSRHRERETSVLPSPLGDGTGNSPGAPGG
jgi:hypothetical protein